MTIRVTARIGLLYLQASNQIFKCSHPVGRRRVRRKPGNIVFAVGIPKAAKSTEGIRQTRWIPTTLGHIAQGEAVGFQLGIASVSKKEHVKTLVCPTTESPGRRPKDSDQPEASLRPMLARVALSSVACIDMANLVREDSG